MEEEKKEKVFFFAFRGFLWGGVYLFLLQGLLLFHLALPVVFHDHHGGVDFAHRQVCGCWKNDKLPCKIRPGWDGTLSRGGNGSGGQDTQTETQTTNTRNNTQQHAEYTSSRDNSVSCQSIEGQTWDSNIKNLNKCWALDMVGLFVSILTKESSVTIFGQW